MNCTNLNLVKAAFLFTVFILIQSCGNAEESETPWRNLITGNDLDGWVKKGGDAEYRIEDGIITGITVHNTPNTFLATEGTYDDFILELEFKVHPSMNSGIQIRSNSLDSYMDGRVHGYQVEIDPSDRAWSGGIYDEARRGWLVDLEGRPEAQQAFEQNEWNKYRIEAIGDTIRTWVNGIPAAHLIDEETSSGFIALQVHSIQDDAEEGTEINWRNIRIITEDLEEYSKETPVEPVRTRNSLTRNEAEDGWELLWDGETTEGWRGARLDDFPDKGWVIENGELVVLATGGAESAAGGDIVTTELYGDFELKFDFKLTEGANSGVKYYVDTDINKGPGSSIGLEYQILDDENHPDAKLGNHEGSRTLASLYDLIQADPEKPVNPVGEWNSGRIVSKDNHVEHWLNGEKVLQYQRKSDNYRKLVSESKYDQWPEFGEKDKGHILLQDHGDRVAFKNIKIKPLE